MVITKCHYFVCHKTLILSFGDKLLLLPVTLIFQVAEIYMSLKTITLLMKYVTFRFTIR